MKNFEVKYSKGHLVDTTTNKRIFLKRGGVFNILGDDNQFKEKDELQFKVKALDKDQKLIALKNWHKGFHLEKAAEKGQLFLYRIGLSKQSLEDKAKEFLFDAIILEDLYLRSKDGEDWSLCDCLCETQKCLEGDVQMIEAVQGNSLNALFSNMITFYFPMQRSGACNAFDYFYFPEEGKKHTLLEVKSNIMKSLGDKRKKIRSAFINSQNGNSNEFNEINPDLKLKVPDHGLLFEE